MHHEVREGLEQCRKGSKHVSGLAGTIYQSWFYWHLSISCRAGDFTIGTATCAWNLCMVCQHGLHPVQPNA